MNDSDSKKLEKEIEKIILELRETISKIQEAYGAPKNFQFSLGTKNGETICRIKFIITPEKKEILLKCPVKKIKEVLDCYKGHLKHVVPAIKTS